MGAVNGGRLRRVQLVILGNAHELVNKMCESGEGGFKRRGLDDLRPPSVGHQAQSNSGGVAYNHIKGLMVSASKKRPVESGPVAE